MKGQEVPARPSASLARSLLVGQRAYHGAKHHGGAKAGDEQFADVAHTEAVVLIQRVHVRALQPVAGCGARGGRAGAGPAVSGRQREGVIPFGDRNRGLPPPTHPS